ncbi:hypothetical protein EPO04_01010 [Patescibacteria group bacterium]|nr:MAG: hypothetical protein EPO04_01010 [Patescibacteria group bacterium]
MRKFLKNSVDWLDTFPGVGISLVVVAVAGAVVGYTTGFGSTLAGWIVEDGVVGSDWEAAILVSTCAATGWFLLLILVIGVQGVIKDFRQDAR